MSWPYKTHSFSYPWPSPPAWLSTLHRKLLAAAVSGASPLKLCGCTTEARLWNFDVCALHTAQPSSHFTSPRVSVGRFLWASATSTQQPARQKAMRKKGQRSTAARLCPCQTLETTFKRTAAFFPNRWSSIGPARRRANHKGHCHPKIFGMGTSEGSPNTCPWKAPAQVRAYHGTHCYHQNQRQGSLPADPEAIQQTWHDITHIAKSLLVLGPHTQSKYFLIYIHFSIFILFLAWSSNTVLQVVFFCYRYCWSKNRLMKVAFQP